MTYVRRFAALIAVSLFFSLGSARAIETIAREAILMDSATGEVLFAKNADAPMTPASMSKLMTVYMIFERLRDGRLSLDDTFTVSENVWRKGGAKSVGVFLEQHFTRARVHEDGFARDGLHGLGGRPGKEEGDGDEDGCADIH